MNNDVVDDLKQFITATVSQQTTTILDDIHDDIKKLDEKLSKKIDDLSQSVAEAMEASNEETHSQLNDHEQRITHLEQKAI